MFSEFAQFTALEHTPAHSTTACFRMQRMSPDKPVNLYQSHQQSHTSYAMSKPPLKVSPSPNDELARSLSNAFYITSYQSDISKYAGNKQNDFSLR